MALYIILAVLIFGVLIFVHEFGHFITAKLLGVKVNEFAMGMGPAFFKRKKGETEYSLRIFPIGGFCAMEGEDEDSRDPRSFNSKPVWGKLIILSAGSIMNFLTGILILLILFSQAAAFYSPTIDGFMDGFPNSSSQSLQVGDRILSIDGENVYVYSDVGLLLSRGNGESYDLVVDRSGQKIVLNDFPLSLREYVIDGQTVTKYGLVFGIEDATPLVILKQTWYSAIDFVRLVKISIMDLVSGSAGVKDLSGPVGIVQIMSNVGQQSASIWDAIGNIAYLGAFIAINLAVMNMLPLPALDGGRVFFLFITWIVEKISRRKINPKYEGYVHAAGLVFFFGLMIFVTYNDIIKIFIK